MAETSSPVTQIDSANESGIANPMRIGAAVVGVLRIVTLVLALSLLFRSEAANLTGSGFTGDPGLFRTLMMVGAWTAVVVSVIHLLALKADSRRRIVTSALMVITSVVFFAIVRGWGHRALLQPLEVASLFSSLFILRMVVADRTD